MDLDKNLKNIIEVLSSGFDNETIQKNQEAFFKIKELYNNTDTNDFLDLIQFAYEDFNTLVENIMNVPSSDKKYILEHIISGLYKHFHTQRIEKIEGSVCCYDKSSYIELMTLKAIKTQKNISLYADYKNVEEIKENKERKAYWSPESVKDTNEAIELFLKWYHLID